MMRKTNENNAPVGIVLSAAAGGILATLLFLLIGAMFIRRGSLEETMIRPWALAGLAIGCIIAAFIAAKCAPGGKFLWAAAAGVIVFLLLLTISLFVARQPIHFIRSAISLLCALIASTIGGFFGATTRKKKRYSRVKK